ncbi:MAG TPA: hypothetical protein VE871_08345 [Longimicrobium sp.]|nr:hypothetical protein [Longimicrobium sp.]
MAIRKFRNFSRCPIASSDAMQSPFCFSGDPADVPRRSVAVLMENNIRAFLHLPSRQNGIQGGEGTWEFALHTNAS